MTQIKPKGLTYRGWSILAVLLISMLMIALQLALMRALSVTRYYHFSYLVISTALLGFGVSGTFLCFFYDRMRQRAVRSIHLLFILLAAAVPASYLVAQQLPIDIQYILLDAEQRWLMLLYTLLLFIPFFLGATLIGFFITYFKREVSDLYGANLLGSGIGGVLALLLMFGIPPIQLPIRLTLLVLISYLCWLMSDRPSYFTTPYRKWSLAGIGIVVLITGGSIMYTAEPHIDPHKSLAHMKRLQKQGDARHLIRTYGPRGQIDFYDSPAIHYTLFAGLQSRVVPPPQLSLLLDGSLAGTVFQIDRARKAKILDYTPQSLPYRLLGDSARVLLLGEAGGTNIWLANRFGAKHITVVQTNPQLVSLMKNELSKPSGRIYLRENVTVVTQSPRHFLEQSEQKFDIIQFARAETMGGGAGGLQSLSENYLLTVEGIREAYQLLSDDGFLTITRGIESPPRDNIKIFALFARAAETAGARKASDRLLQSRNYLAVNTLLHQGPLSDSTLSQFRSVTDSLMMDANYYPGIRPGADPTYNEIGGPEGADYSWYYHAAQQILKGDKKEFYKDWVYNVRPPTDNRPYFSNFVKWSSLDRFRRAYGKYWLQKVELGFVVLLITFAEITLIGFIFILLPLFFRRARFLNTGCTLKTLIYFTATGLGFIFIEMVFIQKFGRFMGDPIYSTGAALTSMLVFAGLGSVSQQHVDWGIRPKVYTAGLFLAGITVAYMYWLDPLFEQLSALSTFVRFLITCGLIFPPAFSLGWFFPIGIGLLRKQAPELVPWAWGVDGFTSVAGAPLALLLSMQFGFNLVLWTGLLFYGLLMATMPRWEV